MNKIKKILAMTLLSTAITIALPVDVSAAWRKDNSGWWYTEGNSWATGWRYINGSWYYFMPNSGYMAIQTTVDGHYLDRNGAWVDDSYFNISAAKAEKIIKDKYYPGQATIFVKCSDIEDDRWLVRAYSDNIYKTTNVGWYYVNKNTGAVSRRAV